MHLKTIALWQNFSLHIKVWFLGTDEGSSNETKSYNHLSDQTLGA